MQRCFPSGMTVFHRAKRHSGQALAIAAIIGSEKHTMKNVHDVMA
jgi:hypothetical protein